MKKKHIEILVIVAVLMISGGIYLICNFNRPRIRSRSGRVIDAVTGDPIAGAVVSYYWEFSGFMGVVDERPAGSYETSTDKNGKYFVPSRRIKR